MPQEPHLRLRTSRGNGDLSTNGGTDGGSAAAGLSTSGRTPSTSPVAEHHDSSGATFNAAVAAAAACPGPAATSSPSGPANGSAPRPHYPQAEESWVARAKRTKRLEPSKWPCFNFGLALTVTLLTFAAFLASEQDPCPEQLSNEACIALRRGLVPLQGGGNGDAAADAATAEREAADVILDRIYFDALVDQQRPQTQHDADDAGGAVDSAHLVLGNLAVADPGAEHPAQLAARRSRRSFAVVPTAATTTTTRSLRRDRVAASIGRGIWRYGGVLKTLRKWIPAVLGASRTRRSREAAWSHDDVCAPLHVDPIPLLLTNSGNSDGNGIAAATGVAAGAMALCTDGSVAEAARHASEWGRRSVMMKTPTAAVAADPRPTPSSTITLAGALAALIHRQDSAAAAAAPGSPDGSVVVALPGSTDAAVAVALAVVKRDRVRLRVRQLLQQQPVDAAALRDSPSLNDASLRRDVAMRVAVDRAARLPPTEVALVVAVEPDPAAHRALLRMVNRHNIEVFGLAGNNHRDVANVPRSTVAMHALTATFDRGSPLLSTQTVHLVNGAAAADLQQQQHSGGAGLRVPLRQRFPRLRADAPGGRNAVLPCWERALASSNNTVTTGGGPAVQLSGCEPCCNLDQPLDAKNSLSSLAAANRRRRFATGAVSLRAVSIERALAETIGGVIARAGESQHTQPTQHRRRGLALVADILPLASKSPIVSSRQALDDLARRRVAWFESQAHNVRVVRSTLLQSSKAAAAVAVPGVAQSFAIDKAFGRRSAIVFLRPLGIRLDGAAIDRLSPHWRQRLDAAESALAEDLAALAQRRAAGVALRADGDGASSSSAAACKSLWDAVDQTVATTASGTTSSVGDDAQPNGVDESLRRAVAEWARSSSSHCAAVYIAPSTSSSGGAAHPKHDDSPTELLRGAVEATLDEEIRLQTLARRLALHEADLVASVLEGRMPDDEASSSLRRLRDGDLLAVPSGADAAAGGGTSSDQQQQQGDGLALAVQLSVLAVALVVGAVLLRGVCRNFRSRSGPPAGSSSAARR